MLSELTQIIWDTNLRLKGFENLVLNRIESTSTLAYILSIFGRNTNTLRFKEPQRFSQAPISGDEPTGLGRGFPSIQNFGA